jgi:hypothetical protein
MVRGLVALLFFSVPTIASELRSKNGPLVFSEKRARFAPPVGPYTSPPAAEREICFLDVT